jgi:hypothetical protein
MTWFVLLDDQLDNENLPDPVGTIRAVRGGIREIFADPAAAPQDPFLATFADIWHELAVGCPAGAQRRFADRFLEYFDAIERTGPATGRVQHSRRTGKWVSWRWKCLPGRCFPARKGSPRPPR